MNKGRATEDVNREFERIIIRHASVNIKVLNSTLHHIIDPFDDIGIVKMGKIDIFIPNGDDATLELGGIKWEHNRVDEVIKANASFLVIQLHVREVEHWNWAPEMRPPLWKDASGNSMFCFEKRENMTDDFVW